MVIRKMQPSDESEIFDMMRIFYDSPALIHKSSDRVLRRDIRDCLDEDNPFVEAFVFEENGQKTGYSMVSKNYTTEYGGLCLWIEDLYFVKEHRHRGHSGEFFSYLERTYPDAVRFKLEVEKENERAVAAYKKNGYNVSEYFLMTKEIEKDEEDECR